jgi:hypothetical protein
VSRYAWPDAGAAQVAEGKDDAGGRAGYNARRRSGSADALARALLREAATTTLPSGLLAKP